MTLPLGQFTTLNNSLENLVSYQHLNPCHLNWIIWGYIKALCRLWYTLASMPAWNNKVFILVIETCLVKVKQPYPFLSICNLKCEICHRCDPFGITSQNSDLHWEHEDCSIQATSVVPKSKCAVPSLWIRWIDTLPYYDAVIWTCTNLNVLKFTKLFLRWPADD